MTHRVATAYEMAGHGLNTRRIFILQRKLMRELASMAPPQCEATA
jgi:hypothetical protein